MLKLTVVGCLLTALQGVLGMYQIGEWVVYGIHGVCRVVGTEKQLVNRKKTQFLVLEPMTQNESRFYLPTENPTAMAKLKAVLSKTELSDLFASDDIRQDAWIQEENHRKQHYRELFVSGDRVALMKMVRTLYRYRTAQAEAGKKTADYFFMCSLPKACLFRQKCNFLYLFYVNRVCIPYTMCRKKQPLCKNLCKMFKTP